jgi:MFS family permease
MALVWRFLHESVEKKNHALDTTGAALLSAGILALLAGASGNVGTWPLGLAAVLLAAFVWVESRAREPILPIDLFRDRVIGLSSIAGALLGASMMATVTYVPLFVQAILGGSATDAGQAITPMVLGWPIASTLSGKLIPRFGFRPMIRIGLSITAASAVAIALLVEPGVPLWVIGVLTCAFGVGMGLGNTALLLAVQTAVSWERRGVATASTMFFRTIGGAIAVGAIGGLIAASLAGQPGVPAGAADALLGPEHGKSLPEALLRTLSGALSSSLHTSFVMIAGLALLAMGVGLLFPRPATVPAAAPQAGV